MYRMTRIISLLGCLLVLSCAPNSVFNPDEVQLRKHKALWESHGMVNYTVTQQISCFCLREYTLPKVLVIENNHVISVNDDSFYQEVHFKRFTIDQAFEFIREQLLRSPAVVRISYDDTYGFPTSIYFDLDGRIADEEINYSYSDFYAFAE